VLQQISFLDVGKYLDRACFFFEQWFLDGKTVGGTAIRGPEETPTRGDALRFYTLGSAWFSLDEKTRGSLEVGKFADLAVLSKDYMTVPPMKSAPSNPCSPWSAAKSFTPRHLTLSDQT
jgi:predicted amidohydrolase YtcJ